MGIIPLKDIWQNKSLVFNFALANVRLRYRGTHLGVLWSALEPLLLFVLLYVVFSNIKEISKEDFAIYLITGIMIYHIFIKGTNGGLGSLVNNANILKSIKIQKEFFPVVSTGTTAIMMLVTIGVFFSLMPIFGFVPEFTLILLPVVLILLLILIQGISYILSIVNVYIRDIQPFWGIFSYALIFVTPIFWYLEDVKGILFTIHGINPLGQIIEIAHKIVFGEIPTLVEWTHVTAMVLGIFFVGHIIFNKVEKRIIEKL